MVYLRSDRTGSRWKWLKSAQRHQRAAGSTSPMASSTAIEKSIFCLYNSYIAIITALTARWRHFPPLPRHRIREWHHPPNEPPDWCQHPAPQTDHHFPRRFSFAWPDQGDQIVEHSTGPPGKWDTTEMTLCKCTFTTKDWRWTNGGSRVSEVPQSEWAPALISRYWGQ